MRDGDGITGAGRSVAATAMVAGAAVQPPAIADTPARPSTLVDLPRRRKLALALMVACAFFMETLDATALAPALPTIAAQFGEAPLHLSLALSSYMITLAILIPASGWAADRFGPRRVFTTAIGLFVLGSVLCSQAGSLPELVAARVVQGFGGAMMSPVGRLVVLQASRKDEIVRMMSWVTIPGLIGPVVGPGLGGALTTFAGWHWIFLINVPIGVLGMVMALRLIPDLPRPPARRLDAKGLALCGLASGGTVFGIDLWATGAVAPWVAACLVAVAGVSLLLFVRHARRVEDPVLDLGILRLRTFAVSLGGGLFFRVGIGALPLLLPLLFQLGFGLSPFESGLLVVASTSGALMMKVVAPALIRRFSYRRLLFWNGVLNAAFFAVQGFFHPGVPWALVLAVLLVGGLARSLQFTALNTIAFAEVPSARLSRATSLSSVFMQVSLTLGVGVGSGLVALLKAVNGADRLGSAEVAPAFFVLGALGLATALAALLLPHDAGDELRGRRESAR